MLGVDVSVLLKKGRKNHEVIQVTCSRGMHWLCSNLLICHFYINHYNIWGKQQKFSQNTTVWAPRGHIVGLQRKQFRLYININKEYSSWRVIMSLLCMLGGGLVNAALVHIWIFIIFGNAFHASSQLQITLLSQHHTDHHSSPKWRNLCTRNNLKGEIPRTLQPLCATGKCKETRWRAHSCPFLTIKHSYFLFFLSGLDICWHQVYSAWEYGWDRFMWTLWALLCSAAALVVNMESSFSAAHPVSGSPKSVLDAELWTRQAVELGYTCNKSKLIQLH